MTSEGHPDRLEDSEDLASRTPTRRALIKAAWAVPAVVMLGDMEFDSFQAVSPFILCEGDDDVEECDDNGEG